MQRHQACLRARANQRQQQHDHAGDHVRMTGPHRRKSVVAARSRKQTERQQQRQRAEACHHEIDETGARILRSAMVGHHQRPGRQRHELPRDQEAERVVRQHDEVHAGEIGREERQHAKRRAFMPAIADAVEARRRAAEIDHHEKERGQRVDPEVRAEARQSDRQDHRLDGGAADQGHGADREPEQRRNQAAAIDQNRAGRGARHADSGDGQRQSAATHHNPTRAGI